MLSERITHVARGYPPRRFELVPWRTIRGREERSDSEGFPRDPLTVPEILAARDHPIETRENRNRRESVRAGYLKPRLSRVSYGSEERMSGA